MNQLFDHFWTSWPAGNFGNLPEIYQPGFQPSIETSEKGDKVIVSAELPGLDEKDIQLQLNADASALILTGEKRYESEEKDEERNFYQSERSYGRFQRAIPLPSQVNPEKIKATFKKGVLMVTMKKDGKGAASRSIPVST